MSYHSLNPLNSRGSSSTGQYTLLVSGHGVLIPLTVGEVVQPTNNLVPEFYLNVLIPLTVGEVVQQLVGSLPGCITTVLIPLTVGEVVQRCHVLWVGRWACLNPLNSRGSSSTTGGVV